MAVVHRCQTKYLFKSRLCRANIDYFQYLRNPDIVILAINDSNQVTLLFFLVTRTSHKIQSSVKFWHIVQDVPHTFFYLDNLSLNIF
jgi:hypothetical protein